MGFMGLLKFALLCFDFLAWPVFALGYPMCASIRAIETGSKYHMRKLVIYWTLFSIIYLFEIAFVKFIEWTPFWSRIKLIATLLLVMPGFDGACRAYESFIHPCLIVNLQGVIIGRFNKPKEEKPRNAETFLDVAEKYIKENGSEALEKLIAIKLKEPDASQKDKEILEATEMSASTEAKQVKSSQRETRVVEAVEKNAAATSKQLKESDAAQKDIQVLEATEKSASTEVQQLSDNVGWVQEETQAAAEIEEMTPLETIAENRHPGPEAPPLKQVQREWTCALCQVTTSSKENLKDHLHGYKHRSNREALKASKRATGKSKAAKNKADVQKLAKPKQDFAARSQTFKLWCGVCNVKLLSEIDLASHLKGKQHSSNIAKMASS